MPVLSGCGSRTFPIKFHAAVSSLEGLIEPGVDVLRGGCLLRLFDGGLKMPLRQLEERLRPIARMRIAEGSLPCASPPRIYAGQGTGKTCALCETTIAPDEVEYEVERAGKDGREVLHFHVVCESIWQLECARRDYLLKHPQANN